MKTYKVKNENLAWIAGKRVPESGIIKLSEAQAEHDLARGNIELFEEKTVKEENTSLAAPRTSITIKEDKKA